MDSFDHEDFLHAVIFFLTKGLSGRLFNHLCWCKVSSKPCCSVRDEFHQMVFKALYFWLEYYYYIICTFQIYMVYVSCENVFTIHQCCGLEDCNN